MGCAAAGAGEGAGQASAGRHRSRWRPAHLDRGQLARSVPRACRRRRVVSPPGGPAPSRTSRAHRSVESPMTSPRSSRSAKPQRCSTCSPPSSAAWTPKAWSVRPARSVGSGATAASNSAHRRSRRADERGHDPRRRPTDDRVRERGRRTPPTTGRRNQHSGPRPVGTTPKVRPHQARSSTHRSPTRTQHDVRGSDGLNNPTAASEREHEPQSLPHAVADRRPLPRRPDPGVRPSTTLAKGGQQMTGRRGPHPKGRDTSRSGSDPRTVTRSNA